MVTNCPQWARTVESPGMWDFQCPSQMVSHLVLCGVCLSLLSMYEDAEGGALVSSTFTVL